MRRQMLFGSAKKQIDHLAYMKERIRIDRLLWLLSDVPRILSFMEAVASIRMPNGQFIFSRTLFDPTGPVQQIDNSIER